MQTDARQLGVYLSTPLIGKMSGEAETAGSKFEEKRSGDNRRRKWSGSVHESARGGRLIIR